MKPTPQELKDYYTWFGSLDGNIPKLEIALAVSRQLAKMYPSFAEDLPKMEKSLTDGLDEITCTHGYTQRYSTYNTGGWRYQKYNTLNERRRQELIEACTGDTVLIEYLALTKEKIVFETFINSIRKQGSLLKIAVLDSGKENTGYNPHASYVPPKTYRSGLLYKWITLVPDRIIKIAQ